MTLNQTMNQFNELPVLGQVDLGGFSSNVISARVDNAQATPLVAGQPVKLATTAGGVPSVVALSANSDATFGYVVYNVKDINYPANSKLEIAIEGTVEWLNSGGSITRGGAVENVYTTPGNVIASGGTNPAIGIAIDGATAANQLTRVYIKVPTLSNAFNTPLVKTATVVATLAQINAGLVLIAGAGAQKITVLDVVARVLGTFATGTSVELESTNGTPVAVLTYAEAAIAGTAVVYPSSANVTSGAGMGIALGAGDGLQVVNNGSAQTGGTSITFIITYTQA